jgi:hypothetical protein
VIALLLEFDQRRSGNRFDLRHDVIRLFGLDHFTQRGTIKHVDHVVAVRNLHGGSPWIAIHCYGLAAETLQLDNQFLAQLSGA